MKAGITLFALAVFIGCLSPTQITLRVTTNASCASGSWQGVAIYVGTPGAGVEGSDPVLISQTCDNGTVGTLVIVPTGANDDQIGVRVVAGLARKPDDCRSNGYSGCIVARRTIRFIPHSDVALDIDLTTSCEGFACDDAHTCMNGSCVDNFVNPGTDAAPPTGPVVRCGDVFCPTTGQVCCLTYEFDGGVASGQCMQPDKCSGPGTAVMYCDDSSDCASIGNDDAGKPPVCCMAGHILGYCSVSPVTGSQCVPNSACTGVGGFSASALVLCNDGLPCPGSGFVCGASNVLPGYKSCCL